MTGGQYSRDDCGPKRPVTSSLGEQANRGTLAGERSSPERGALVATKLHVPALGTSASACQRW